MAGRVVACLALSQLVCWGISYYLIGVLGGRIAADLGWSDELVYGGFSLALLVMGVSSPLLGRMIDRTGGRGVMLAGSALIALGCSGLALSHGVVGYYAAWFCLGIAMRCTLYDAAFATLARLGGTDAKRAMARVTLAGGLASTVFWPLGNHLATEFGWRGAVAVYAVLALMTVPLHAAIPRTSAPAAMRGHREHRAVPDLPCRLTSTLYAVITALTSVINAAMSAHMIGLLAGLGLAAPIAVRIAAVRGIGQSAARLGEVLFGGRVHPLDLNLATMLVLPLSFVAAMFGNLAVPALLFAFTYGASNGLATITRGTMPLVLFDSRGYGARTGSLLAPSFVLSAAAPLAYAFVMARMGARAALVLSIALAVAVLLASIALRLAAGTVRDSA